MYDTITNYNDWNHTPLPNKNNRETIYQLMIEEKTKANNVTVDTLSPQIYKSEKLINKFANLTINDVGNDLIDKW